MTLVPTIEHSGGNVWTITVPTETGRDAIVDITHDVALDVYYWSFHGELLDQSPEGLTAFMQMAMLTLRQTR